MTEEQWAPALVIKIWRDCERFTAACAPAIGAVAAGLLARGELGYGELARLTAAALPEPPPVPPWARWTPGDWDRWFDAAHQSAAADGSITAASQLPRERTAPWLVTRGSDPPRLPGLR